MHEPGVTQLPFAVAAAAISVGYGVYSGMQKKKAANKEAESYEFNAHQIELDTADELRQQRREAYKVYGSAQAGAGANGLAQSGSVLDVLAESARNAQEDAGTIARRGAANAELVRRGAEAKRAEGNAGLISGVVSGVANGVSAYGNYASSASSSQPSSYTQNALINAPKRVPYA